MPDPDPKPSRIQLRNRARILEAALDVFSLNGYRGATLDAISEASGMSKPNILYYFGGKEEIYLTVLNQLVGTWLDPLLEMDPDGEPIEEIIRYVLRKLDMSRDMPRESRLFANEIIQGAPRMRASLESELKPLFDEKCQLIHNWIDDGKIAKLDPQHLLFSIWANTQHYADFEVQVAVLADTGSHEAAHAFLETLYRRLLQPI